MTPGHDILCLFWLSVCPQVEEATMVMEDDSPAELACTPGTLRNLSAWTISIPYIDFYDDEIRRERVPVFCIDVERNDRKEGEGTCNVIHLPIHLHLLLIHIFLFSFLFAVGHETEIWSVYRRYLEFYVLESKLTEFHGNSLSLANII